MLPEDIDGTLMLFPGGRRMGSGWLGGAGGLG
jgi:hypothetical protein